MHKLLLADASTMVHRIIALTFSREDVHVIAVGDGEQAIALIPIARPDIVLADHATPVRDGYDVAAFVKSNPDLAHIPVLLLGGAFEPVDEVRAARAGCDGVLVKPFEPQHLIARVRELIEASKNAASTPAPPGPAVVRASVLKLVEPQPREKVDLAPLEDRPMEGTPGAGPLDEYFDRLDAALGSLEGGPGSSNSAGPVRIEQTDRELAPMHDDVDVPTLNAILGRDLPSAARPHRELDLDRSRAPVPTELVPATPVSFATPPEPSGRPSDLSALVKALEELRQTPIHRQPPASSAQRDVPSDSFAMTDEMIDEVTRRVAERLAPNAVSQVVSDIVTDVAERLVREEIARIRSSSQP